MNWVIPGMRIMIRNYQKGWKSSQVVIQDQSELLSYVTIRQNRDVIRVTITMVVPPQKAQIRISTEGKILLSR